MSEMGRPKMDPAKRRGEITQVRLTAPERERVEAAARKKKQRLSAWMREILLENAPPLP